MTKAETYEIIILVTPNASMQDLKCLRMIQLSTHSTEVGSCAAKGLLKLRVVGNANVGLFVLQQLPKIPAQVLRRPTDTVAPQFHTIFSIISSVY